MTALDKQVLELSLRLKDLGLAKGKTCAVAESCTGGLVGGAITAVPGSSAYFLGGIISYADSVKEALLKVSGQVLALHGAVSGPCAAAMAQGARTLTGADLAVAVTGVAGPEGGSPEKPLGTVWFGLAGQAVETELCRFDGDRGAVRRQSVVKALELLISALERWS